MKSSEVRKYRSMLRQFQQLVGRQDKLCSCSVTLAQCVVLLDIDEHEMETVGQLASHLRLDSSTLSRTVDGLVRKHLVVRERDESDRRVVWVSLSAEGASLCAEIHKNNDAFARSVLERIPEAERSNVLRCFELLVQAYIDHET